MKFVIICFLIALIGQLNCQDTVDKNKTSTTTTSTSTTTLSPTEPTTDKTSTTSVPNTSTAAPPEQKSVLLHFNITQDKNVCALFNFMARIDLTNETTESIYLNESTTVDTKNSKCGVNETTLVLLINNQADKTLTLKLNHTSPKYSLSTVSYSDPLKALYSNETVQFTVDDNKSYLCLTYRVISLSKEDAKPKVTLTLEHLQIDAFRTEKDGSDYRQAIQCDLDFPTNDFVPLAVGCALISLVFIVLIAYIVGRKRSRRLTYQSV